MLETPTELLRQVENLESHASAIVMRNRLLVTNQHADSLGLLLRVFLLVAFFDRLLEVADALT